MGVKVGLRSNNPKTRMSQLGHSLQVRPRPLVHKCPLCINTDRKFWALGFVANPTSAELIDHLVGELLQMQRHVETKYFSSLEIDPQFDLCWLLYW
jgi:hypothetical protein